MNLDFSISSICSLTGADFIEHSLLHVPDQISSIVIDSRSPAIGPHTLFITLQGEKTDGRFFVDDFIHKGGKIILTSGKLDLNVHQIIHPDPLAALQQLARAHRERFSIPVIGITGSNGKTIVKEWLYHVLKGSKKIVRSPKSYNSQIGVPLSVLEMNEDHELAIFEAGISRPGEMEKLERIIQPTLGVFTGIGDAHSAFFNSESHKKQEKFILFRNAGLLLSAEETEQADESEIPFSDQASLQNAGLVKAVAKVVVPDLSIASRLSTLPVVSMRMEQLEGQRNCILLNDAYNADLTSLEIGLRQMKQLARQRSTCLILTDFEDQKLNVGRLSEIIRSANPDRLIYIGSELLPEELQAEKYNSVDAFLSEAKMPEHAVVLLKGSRKAMLEKVVAALAEKKHITRLTINFSALRQNLNYFKSLAQGCKILAMVKAQAYGGGLLELAHFYEAQGIDFFGVAYADEGVRLREAGIELPILVMNPEADAFDAIINYELEPSIYSQEMLNDFIHHLIIRGRYRFPIHIKLDTGMNRLGFQDEQVAELCDVIQTQPEVVVASVFSHLSVADDAEENEFTYGQVRKFEFMTGRIRDRIGYDFDRHLANSAGTVNYPRAHFDMVRLGIGLFGLIGRDELENVLSFTSRISQVKWINEGDSVGYGRSYIADKKTKIGIVPVGYADGLSRALSQGNWSILVNGKRAPIIGNICMDMCMINLTDVEARSGDEAVIFGQENSVTEMADILHTIPYEIIAGISQRVHRVYVDE